MKIVVILSGGMDSATLLYELLSAGHTVEALTFSYGKSPSKEVLAASGLCRSLGVHHNIADVSHVFSLLSGQILIPVPEIHRSGVDESFSARTIQVPNRNMIFVSLGLSRAISVGADAVAYAANASDHSVYPDCRPVFVELLSTIATICDWHSVKLLRPFINLEKSDIIAIGDRLHVPYEKTWSCIHGGKVHCGICPTCKERRTAFRIAKVTDRTVYQSDPEDKTP